MLHVQVLEDDPNGDLRAFVLDGLVAYNTSKAGPSRMRPLSIALRDQDGAIRGGLCGRSGYDWVFVELLFVSEDARGERWGSELMAAAEREAEARGCVGVWLDTFAFQARDFYESLGYTVFGVLDDAPRGSCRYFMKKVLRGSTR